MDEGTTAPEVRSFLDRPVPTPQITPRAAPQRRCERPTLIGQIIPASLTVRTLPSIGAPPVATFHRTNAQGAKQVFDLQSAVRNPAGDLWYRALLPMRPSGTSGYIAAGSVRVVQTLYRVDVDRHKLRLTLWDGCTAVMRFPIGLGNESTPTPNGRYYIIALLKRPLAG